MWGSERKGYSVDGAGQCFEVNRQQKRIHLFFEVYHESRGKDNEFVDLGLKTIALIARF
jgi:hypothetical protein